MIKNLRSYLGILIYALGITLQFYAIVIRLFKFLSNAPDFKGFINYSDIPIKSYFIGLAMILLGILIQNNIESRLKMYYLIPFLFILLTGTSYFAAFNMI